MHAYMNIYACACMYTYAHVIYIILYNMHSNIYYCVCILYIYTHTHTHTLYMCVHVCVCIKNTPANAGDTGLIPGSGRSPGEGHATHSSILAWEKYHGQRSPVGYSPWGHQRARHDLATQQQLVHMYVCMPSHSVVSNSL